MPRSSSEEFLQIAYAESSGDGLIDLIVVSELDGTPYVPPLRFARNGEAVTSNGEVYEAFWFEIQAPELRADGSFTQSRLRIDAVDQRMVLALRNRTRPMLLVHTCVLISDPDAVTHGPWTYLVRGDQPWDPQTLELSLTFEPTLQEMVPWKRASPSRAPGLH